MASARDDYEVFDLSDFVLQGGATPRGTRLAYKTYGTLDGAKDNAIVYPTWYSGRHWTHFHADFVAGHLELRDREGATIHLGARA